jgi:hypothetical protein
MVLTKEIIINDCKEFWDLVSNQNGLVENSDGSLSVYLTDSNGIKSPVQITKQCCDVLAKTSGKDYYFDLDEQKCRWSKINDCDINQPFNIVLNPLGNDGTIFYNQNDENCFLDINFDYLINLDCGKIVELINQESQLLSNPNYVDIVNLQQQISELTVKCDDLSNKIEYIKTSIDKSNYSINCVNFPLDTNQDSQLAPITLTEKEKIPFTKTGFGGLAPLSFPRLALYRTVNFCINEPEGLNVWKNILGVFNYQLFLEGDSNSYSCANVIDFFNQNQNNLSINPTATPYFFECDTPFGFKTDLIKQLNQLIDEQKKCQLVINELTIKLNQLISEFGFNNVECFSPISLMENIDLSVTLDVINQDGTLTTVFEENFFKRIGDDNLYLYLVNNPSSGFYINGLSDETNDYIPLIFPNLTGQGLPQDFNLDVLNNSTCGRQVQDYLLKNLFLQSNLNQQQNGMSVFLQSLSPTMLASNWLNYNFSIQDENILSLIKDKKIKINIKVNNTCNDFCLMVDNIKLDKNCVDTDQTTLYIQESPSFNLTKIIDNKKSWVNNETRVNRNFDIETVFGDNPIRQTNYTTLDERLVINSKEIDLNINITKAIETDVWNFILNNECILTGSTSCDPCQCDKTFQDLECFDFQDSLPYDFMDTNNTNLNNVFCCGDEGLDFNHLLQTNIREIEIVDDFKNVLLTELIDVKNRKTISNYATLKSLYERYLHSMNYCGVEIKPFTYYTIEQFANLIGDYWVDLIEQVIPATTIWGSVKIYTNTIFDQQKFKYREYSTLLCNNEFEGINTPSSITYIDEMKKNCEDIEILTTTVIIDSESDFKLNEVYNKCDKICISQINSGSEFIGTVKIIDNNLLF